MNVDYNQVTKLLDWLKEKIRLDNSSNSARGRLVKRGQVYRCNFGCGIGSEMNKERPAIIVQNDIGNMHSGNTIVIPITHDNSKLPCVANIEPKIEESTGRVILDGQANASNMLCVSKARLGEFVCDLSNIDMKMVDEAIAKSVDIMSYYADIRKKLVNRDNYIERLKNERNAAQDELSRLKELLQIEDGQKLEDIVMDLKNSIDKK